MDELRFGRYRLDDLLGRGGMGEVYRAYDTERDRVIALKVLPAALAADDEYRKRFRRESHHAARLREPHVIPIHDYGEIDDRLYIDMRLVDGVTVAELLAQGGPLAPQRAVNLLSQVAEALDAAHSDGLVHRDVKPSNVLVTATDFVYVVDFGIAHVMGTRSTVLTMTGATVGTLDYMAPERFQHHTCDGRADVYSMTCLLHQCLTGRPPFSGEDLPTLLYAHLYTAPPRPSEANPAVPAAMDAVIARGMAKHPDHRFATAGELAAAARAALGVVAREPRADETVAVQTVGVGAGVGAGGGVAGGVGGGGPGDVGSRDVGSRGVGSRGVGSAGVGSGGVSSGVAGLAATTGPESSATVIPRPRPGPQADPREISGPVGHPGSWPAPPSPHAFDGAPTAAPAPPAHPPQFAAPGAVPPGSAPPGPPPASGPSSRRGVIAAVAAALVVLVIGAVVLSRMLGAEPGGTAGDAAAAPGVPVPTASGEAVEVVASMAIPQVGPTIAAGAPAGFVAAAPNGRQLYVANRATQTVTVIDTAIDQVTATIPIEIGPPQFIAFTPDGTRAYVSVFTEERTINRVAVLDTATNSVLTSIPVGIRPFALAVSPDGRTLYVPNHDSGSLSVIDVATNEITAEIEVAENPHWVTFSPDGATLWMANHESNVISALDTATNTVRGEVPTQTSPHSVDVNPDGTRVANVNFDAASVTITDTATDQVVATVPVGENPQALTYAQDGRFVYVANVESDNLSVISAETNEVTATIPTGDGPTSIALSPDGARAYVTNLNDGTVLVLDTAAS